VRHVFEWRQPCQCLAASVGWAFLEQLALAAIDVGRMDVAEVCLALLVQSLYFGLTNEALAMSATTL
jgi:hypothetical protein